MHIAPLPSNETQRLDRLKAYGVLDTLPQKAFDDITALASAICGTPIALISLVDENRQWFKSKLGLEPSETSRDVAFCSHAINEPQSVMVVENAALDARFADNPLVLEDPAIRFYAGAPIVTDDGFALGTVCVIDREPRKLSKAKKDALKSLANLVVTLLNHELRQAELQQVISRDTQHHRELMAKVTASGLDLISFVGPDYVYRYVNERYLSYWQKDASDIIGHKVSDLLGTAFFESYIKPYFDRALAGEEVAYEAPIDFPGMGKRYTEVTYIPARDIGGMSGVVVRVHDIDALKQRETQLQNTVDLLERKTLEQDRFIHIISHDLREPINTINNFTSLLVDDESLNLPASAARYLKFVAAGGQRMKLLLDDLMGFLEIDGHEFHKQRVEMTAIASQVRDDLTSAMERSHGRIEFGHLPMAFGDPSMLRIALQNLVANALKFVAPGAQPVVKISAYFEGNCLFVEVRDNGIGMESHQVSRIFEMFKRLHSTKIYAGTGLGLSICRRIAELHGGEIKVSSVLGEGSCFTLSLPAAPADHQERNGDEHI